MVKVQRPSRKGVGLKAGVEARGLPVWGVMIWSGLTGNRKRLSEADSRNKTQNLPRAFGDEFQIRKAFIAGPGKKLITADYDQLEMFLMAHWSQDEGMLRSIYDGKDLHSGTAALVWDVPYEDIVAAKKKSEDELSDYERQLLEYRQFAKVIGFGLLYGKGPKLLSTELKIPEKIAKKVTKSVKARNPNADKEYIEKCIMWAAKDEAQNIIDKFFSRMPGAEKFIIHTHRRVADDKFVETIIGRRRWLRQVMDWDDQIRHAERAAAEGHNACWCGDCAESRAGDRRSVNTIIQGSAADVAQAAMIRCHYDPQMADATMLFQVHDEISFEVPEEQAEEMAERIKYNMEHPGIELSVPLKVSPGIGDNWIESK